MAATPPPTAVPTQAAAAAVVAQPWGGSFRTHDEDAPAHVITEEARRHARLRELHASAVRHCHLAILHTNLLFNVSLLHQQVLLQATTAATRAVRRRVRARKLRQALTLAATELARELLAWRAPKVEVYTLTPRGPLPFERALAELTDDGFRREYRLSRNRFRLLLTRCKESPFWVPNRRESHIPAGLWLAMVIEQLAKGTSSRILAQKHQVCEGGFSRRREWVLKSIIWALGTDSPDTQLGWPSKNDAAAWRSLAMEFVPSLDSRCASFFGTVAAGMAACARWERTAFPEKMDYLPLSKLRLAGDGTLVPIDITHVHHLEREGYRCRKV